MKYLNTILIALLFVGLGILYFLHFKTGEQKAPVAQSGESKTSSIAYVNIDSLLSKMEMYKDLQDQLALKKQNLESNFAARYKSFEKNVNDIQKRFSDPSAIITPIQREQIDQQLSKQKMDLDNLQNNYMLQLQDEGTEANRQIIEYITAYLKTYTADKGLQYVFSYGFGGNILYTDSTLDITSDVLFGINEKYMKEKAAKK